jgi:hypothetical protein
MPFTDLIKKLTDRVGSLSDSLEKSVIFRKDIEDTLKNHLASHNLIVGAKLEAENCLSIITEAAELFAPASPTTQLLEGAEKLVEIIDPKTPTN